MSSGSSGLESDALSGNRAPSSILHLTPLDSDTPLLPRPANYTRFVLISDTHTHTFPVPDGDILLHAGDLTEYGSVKELRKTVDWLVAMPHRHKIVIAGNHDHCLDLDTLTEHAALYSGSRGSPKSIKKLPEEYRAAMALLESAEARKSGLVYLKDESLEINIPSDGQIGKPTKWRVFGSPWSAAFCSMAFNIPRGSPSADLYSRIPDDTSILMTHGPPAGIHDHIRHGGRSVGCDRLLTRVTGLRPRLHVFGHIHEDRGVTVKRWRGSDASSSRLTAGVGAAANGATTEGGKEDDAEGETVFVNAANAGTFARPRRWGTHEYQPIVVDLLNPPPGPANNALAEEGNARNGQGSGRL